METVRLVCAPPQVGCLWAQAWVDSAYALVRLCQAGLWRLLVEVIAILFYAVCIKT